MAQQAADDPKEDWYADMCRHYLLAARAAKPRHDAILLFPVCLVNGVKPLLWAWLGLLAGALVRPARILATLLIPDGTAPSTYVTACTVDAEVSFLPAG